MRLRVVKEGSTSARYPQRGAVEKISCGGSKPSSPKIRAANKKPGTRLAVTGSCTPRRVLFRADARLKIEFRDCLEPLRDVVARRALDRQA